MVIYGNSAPEKVTFPATHRNMTLGAMHLPLCSFPVSPVFSVVKNFARTGTESGARTNKSTITGGGILRQ
jgi:hypothetical protein